MTEQKPTQSISESSRLEQSRVLRLISLFLRGLVCLLRAEIHDATTREEPAAEQEVKQAEACEIGTDCQQRSRDGDLRKEEQPLFSRTTLAWMEAVKVEQRMKMHQRLGLLLLLVAVLLSAYFGFTRTQHPELIFASILYLRFGFSTIVVLGVAKFFYSQYRIDCEDYKRLINIVLEQESETNLANGETTTTLEMAKIQESADYLKKIVELIPTDFFHGQR